MKKLTAILAASVIVSTLVYGVAHAETKPPTGSPVVGETKPPIGSPTIG